MPKGYHHLTYSQRSQIAVLIARGDSKNQISKTLNVHHTTIGREIKRNSDDETYSHEKAQAKTESRIPSKANKKK